MSRKTDVDLVLVSPGGREDTYQSLATRLTAIEPPVWAGLMASFVRRAGHSVAILDANAEGLGASATAERVAEMRPRLAAVVVYGHQPSASTQVMPAAGAIATALKQREPEIPVVLVGGHVAAVPERTLAEESADFVADGEGLYTLIDLIEALGSGSPELSKVRGLWYREGGVICRTASPPLVDDVDSQMPGVAWDLLPMDRYRAHNWHCFGEPSRTPYAALYTTLGCPYKCSFCCIQAPFKSGEGLAGYKASVNSYRFWSVANVAAQLETLVERHGVRHLKIADEMFVLNLRHVNAICDLITERGWDLNIWAYARVDTVKEAMIDKLARAGFRWLAFGIEAASEHVRADVDKAFSAELISRSVERVRAAGIHVIGNYIFGLPEDDRESMQQTLDMAIDLECEFANFYCAMAYPGSSLYQRALTEGWALPESWSGYSQHSVDSLPLPTRHLNAGEVLRFRDEAFHSYFESPRYLAAVQRRFGPETTLQIQEMASHRLVRRYAV